MLLLRGQFASIEVVVIGAPANSEDPPDTNNGNSIKEGPSEALKVKKRLDLRIPEEENDLWIFCEGDQIDF